MEYTVLIPDHTRRVPDSELDMVEDFWEHCVASKNTLGYSNRVLHGIKYMGCYLHKGDANIPAFDKWVESMARRVRKAIGRPTLVVVSVEFSNQSLRQKSAWHVDCRDGRPFVNVFVPLDPLGEGNGMTTLRQADCVTEMRAERGQWYTFDGGVEHCAGAAACSGGLRRIVMLVFRLAVDLQLTIGAHSSYKRTLTSRSPLIIHDTVPLARAIHLVTMGGMREERFRAQSVPMYSGWSVLACLLQSRFSYFYTLQPLVLMY